VPVAAGGISSRRPYSTGEEVANSVFYMLKRVSYMHAVWHLFVLGGAVCHFLAIALFVM
jgi:channel protein (hemolysin III family)